MCSNFLLSRTVLFLASFSTIYLSVLNKMSVSNVATSKKKLVIVGDTSSGKTSLFTVFSQNQFPQCCMPTVFDKYEENIKVDEKHVEFVVWDTSGQSHYDSLRPMAYLGSDVILMCFSFDSPASLKNIFEKWKPELRKFCPKVPIILVGNKIDLCKDSRIIDMLEKLNQQPVKSEEGESMAKKINAFAYLESSAKNKEGVKEVFETIARIVLQVKKKDKEKCCKLL